MIKLVDQPIDTSQLLSQVTSKSAGAVVLFLGITREFTHGRQTVHLEYQAYGEMALRELEKLQDEARHRWPLTECAIVHRVGPVPLSEVSVAIACSAPHREQAFAAAKWLIDTLKQQVPIWKEEHWADGTREWIHPGMNPSPAAQGGDQP